MRGHVDVLLRAEASRRAAAQERQHAYAESWAATQLARCGPADVLDIAYLYFRIGRWVGAGSRGSSLKVLRLLDNRFSREVLAMDAGTKRSHYLHRELIARLLPAVRDLPLASKFWNDTPEEERARLRASYPDACSQEKQSAATRTKRSFLQRMRERLRSPDPALQPMRFFLGAYSAAVLLSEDWRARRVPSRLIVVGKPRPPTRQRRAESSHA